VRASLLVFVAGCGRLDFQPINANIGAILDGQSIATVDSVTNEPVTLTGVYAISGTGIGPTSVVTIDLATGDVATIGQLPGSLGVLGGLTSWDATRSTLPAVIISSRSRSCRSPRRWRP
jgi:hypothetical protein